MLEVMFVIGFLSYLIQNAVSEISYAVRGELPPRAQLKMAQLNAAAGGAAPQSLRYRMRDYVGDWISDALQQARDDRRERAEARRRGDDPEQPAGDTDGVDEAPELDTTGSDRRDHRVVADGWWDDDRWDDNKRGDTPPTPAPSSTVGDAPDLATTSADPAASPASASSPAPQPASAGPQPQDDAAPPPATPREQLKINASLFGRCGVPKRTGRGRCNAATAKNSIFCGHHDRMFAEHPEWLSERLGETPPAEHEAGCHNCGWQQGGLTAAAAQAAANAHTCPPPAPERAAEPGAPAEEGRPQLRLVRPEDTPSGDTVPSTTGEDARPAPITDPGHTAPEQGDSTVSTTASAETTNIDAAKAFLTELGEHITDDLLAKVQTATATLAGKNIDSDTLGILSRIQEQGQVLAGLCSEGVEHIDSYHGLMKQAVDNTEEVADTEFYRSH